MTCTYWLTAIVDDIEFEASLWDASLLGCSPSEMLANPEDDRQRSWHTHDGEAELRLWEDGFSQL